MGARASRVVFALALVLVCACAGEEPETSTSDQATSGGATTVITTKPFLTTDLEQSGSATSSSSADTIESDSETAVESASESASESESGGECEPQLDECLAEADTDEAVELCYLAFEECAGGGGGEHSHEVLCDMFCGTMTRCGVLEGEALESCFPACMEGFEALNEDCAVILAERTECVAGLGCEDAQQWSQMPADGYPCQDFDVELEMWCS